MLRAGITVAAGASDRCERARAETTRLLAATVGGESRCLSMKVYRDYEG